GGAGAAYVGAGSTLLSGGTTSPASVPLAAGGAAAMVHSVVMTNRAVSNLINDVSKIHGNSKNSTNEQHGYEIKNKKTGETTEYGISGQKLKKDGTSPRVDQKLNTKYEKKSDYEGKVIKTGMKDRKEGLNWEKGKVEEYKENNGGQKPPQQKRP